MELIKLVKKNLNGEKSFYRIYAEIDSIKFEIKLITEKGIIGQRKRIKSTHLIKNSDIKLSGKKGIDTLEKYAKELGNKIYLKKRKEGYELLNEKEDCINMDEDNKNDDISKINNIDVNINNDICKNNDSIINNNLDENNNNNNKTELNNKGTNLLSIENQMNTNNSQNKSVELKNDNKISNEINNIEISSKNSSELNNYTNNYQTNTKIFINVNQKNMFDCDFNIDEINTADFTENISEINSSINSNITNSYIGLKSESISNNGKISNSYQSNNPQINDNNNICEIDNMNGYNNNDINEDNTSEKNNEEKKIKNIQKNSEYNKYKNIKNFKSKEEESIFQPLTSMIKPSYPTTPRFYYPMSVYPYEQMKNEIIFPCYVQPISSGIRCVAVNTDLYSRFGNMFPTLSHIAEELMKNTENIVLDGELLYPNVNFEYFMDLLKTKNKTLEEEKRALNIYYNVFDYIEPDLTFEQRISNLNFFFKQKNFKYIKFGKTEKCYKRKDIYKFVDKYSILGYNGLIIRNAHGVYEPSVKSVNAQIIRKFYFIDCYVIDYTTPSSGKEQGCVIWICLSPNGNYFNVKPVGTVEERKYLYLHGKKYIGKKLVVKYQHLTVDGTPKYAKGIYFKK